MCFRFGKLHTGGFNMTVANVAINYNIFNFVHTKAFTLKQWDSLSINNNTFKELEPDAFSSQGHMKTKPPVINFTRNNLMKIPSNAFDFEVNDELNPSIDSNFFHFKCYCDMSKSVMRMVKPSHLSISLYQTGLCAVDHRMSKCYDLPEGFWSMSNYTDEVCSADEFILCEEIQRDAAIPPLPGITSAVDIEYEDDIEQDRRILGSIFIVVLLGMLIMMVLSTFMWIGRNGYCTKARILMFPSTNSFVSYLTRLFSGGGMTPTGSAHSISRLSIHEYAELQRNIGEAKKARAEEEEIPLEDKATQTLPEELTQELLQSLQEKLNDPENYSEARNMIEHLYDLIKVEESCNKNYKDSHSINIEDLDKDQENLYDVIVPKRKMSTPRNRKNMVSQGTRAPSPDKLLPYPIYGETKRLQPAVSDYMEPKDRQVHTYTELPNNRVPPGQASVVCDYGEPNDTRVHLYTELPANVKMANRPLPSKPVDGEAMS